MPNCTPQGALISIRTSEILKAKHWARAWCSAGCQQMLVPGPSNFSLPTYRADVGASKSSYIQLQMVHGFYESETRSAWVGGISVIVDPSRSLLQRWHLCLVCKGYGRKTTWWSVAFITLSRWSTRVSVERSLVPICNPSQVRWLCYFCDPLGLTGAVVLLVPHRIVRSSVRDPSP